MASEVKAYRSATGRLFTTEQEAVTDETVVERERRMANLIGRAWRLDYCSPGDMARFLCEQRHTVLAIMQPDVLSA